MHLKSIVSPATLVCAAAVVVTSVFTGCATVTRGTTEQLTVTSAPTGATVRLSNGFTGVTPATFTVSRKEELMVSVWKDGYEQQDVKVTTALAGAGTAGLLGNVLIGGIIGGGIDVATGATLSHSPNPVHVALIQKLQPTPANTAAQPPPAATGTSSNPATPPPPPAPVDATPPAPSPAASVATDSTEPPKPATPVNAPQARQTP